MQSCPELKNIMEKESTSDTEQNMTKTKRYVSCGYCGKLVEDILTFCSHCGFEKAHANNHSKFQAETAPDEPSEQLSNEPKEEAAAEALLYRHDATVYLRGLVPSSGALMISDREIRFTPQTAFRFMQPVSIVLKNVTEVDCSSSASLGFVIKITTKAGVMHKFSLGHVPDKDNIRQVLTHLNQIIQVK